MRRPWPLCGSALLALSVQVAMSGCLQRPDDWLATHAPPAYQALAAQLVGQETDSDCSVASAVMVVNALRQRDGLPSLDERRFLQLAEDPEWAKATVQGGPGVGFEAFQEHLRLGLSRVGYPQASTDLFVPLGTSPAELAEMRRFLEDDDHGRDYFLAVFDQGILTGGQRIGHISPIGAYDPLAGRVLVLDVDRETWPPYWSSEMSMLSAMSEWDPEDPGGGIIRIRVAADRSTADGRARR